MVASILQVLALEPANGGGEATIGSCLREAGLGADRYVAETPDGWRLTMFRVRPMVEAPADEEDTPRPPVLLQHGLLQTPITFVVGGRRSLAAVLYDAGYDVWLGNNRTNIHSMEHVRLQPHQEEFWRCTIDDFAVDTSTMAHAVLRHAASDSLAFIGHSQGACQGMMALSRDAGLRAKVRFCGLVAPAGFVQRFKKWPAVSLRQIYGLGWFYPMLGHGRFLDFPCWLKPALGPEGSARAIPPCAPFHLLLRPCRHQLLHVRLLLRAPRVEHPPVACADPDCLHGRDPWWRRGLGAGTLVPTRGHRALRYV